MSANPEPVIMQVTAVYEYELEPDLECRRRAYGTVDPDACAKVDAGTDDLALLVAGADLKSFTVEAVTRLTNEAVTRLTNAEVVAVECPYCKAQPGEWCKDYANGTVLKLHAKRVRAAREHAKEAAR